MEYRSLGRSGLRVSAVGLGCNNFGRPGSRTEGQEGSTAVIHAALDAGITLFDTADIYGYQYGRSETFMGKALAGQRDKIVLATKFGHRDYPSDIESWDAKGSRRYVRLAVEQSLRRLETEWIDLYQLHTPDPLTPVEETLAALDELIQEGKIRYIGHSNFAAWQAADAEYRAQLGGHPRFISAQNEYSLLVRDAEHELLPALEHYGIGFLPFFPLYNGLFTGKFTRDGGPAESRIMIQRPHLLKNAPWDAIEDYQRLCDEWGVTMLAATFGWLLSRGVLSSVIAGATTPEQVQENAVVGNSWRPDATQVAQIDALFPPSQS
ncbi:aldo/keto reductase [Lysinibacter sp. HNR]|uniref:aldo/keto reductase n=1 Tax=Lysinibacter sp. HNR TaxID=3031408 RepID=UPI002435A16B|nr:aldo/keto reductase [Lysinibacter sp. HNR]WGD36426.1 aldo/keto reductase [Lysinibacter sp. HNR]